MRNGREQLEEQLRIQNEGKSPDEIIQESFERTKALINAEKEAEKEDVKNRLGAMRAIFNACNPKPSDRFKR